MKTYAGVKDVSDAILREESFLLNVREQAVTLHFKNGYYFVYPGEVESPSVFYKDRMISKAVAVNMLDEDGIGVFMEHIANLLNL